MKLFCVPYAGSGASFYGPWRRRFQGLVEIAPVQLPGREELWGRPYLADMAAAAAWVADFVDSKSDGPFAFFGHSMGALLAYEALHVLRGRGKRAQALLVSAFPGPSVFKPRLRVAAMEQDGHAELRRLLGPSFAELLDEPELFDYVARTMRADVLLCEEYRYPGRPVLDLPLHAFGARGDPICTVDELLSWRSHCAGPFETRFFEGDHFYLKGNKDFEGALESVLRLYA